MIYVDKFRSFWGFKQSHSGWTIKISILLIFLAIGCDGGAKNYERGRQSVQVGKLDEAVKWFRKAADQGNPEAQLWLAEAYSGDRGISKNVEESFKWYRKAAENGNAVAQLNLGIMFAEGLGVARDQGEAVKWYRQAAEKGNAEAENNLADAYAGGKGVGQDMSECLKWLHRGAEHGSARAQLSLGLCYLYGQGETIDFIKGYEWIEKSSSQGFEPAKAVLNRQGPEMEEAEKMTRLATTFVNLIGKQAAVRERVPFVMTTATAQRGRPLGTITVHFLMHSEYADGGNNTALTLEEHAHIATCSLALKQVLEKNFNNKIACSEVLFQSLWGIKTGVLLGIDYKKLAQIIDSPDNKTMDASLIGTKIVQAGTYRKNNG